MRLWVILGAVFVLAVHIGAALVLRGGGDSACTLRLADQIAMLTIGIALSGGVLLFTRPGSVPARRASRCATSGRETRPVGRCSWAVVPRRARRGRVSNCRTTSTCRGRGAGQGRPRVRSTPWTGSANSKPGTAGVSSATTNLDSCPTPRHTARLPAPSRRNRGSTSSATRTAGSSTSVRRRTSARV